MRRLLLAGGLGVALALVIGWLWFGGRTWRSNSGANPASGAPPANAGATPGAAANAAAPEDARRIRATLFYVAEDGSRLQGADREVPYADTSIEQARRLIEALLKPVDPPLLQSIPTGTTLTAVGPQPQAP